MQLHPVLRASLCCLALSCAGCVSQPPALPFGASVSLAMAQQVLDPTAGAKHQTVDGMGGQEAKSAHDAYQKSFRAPQPQPNVFTIGVGGGR
ncbi:pilus assembly protein [Massilia sp. SYSU DXS3249]